MALRDLAPDDPTELGGYRLRGRLGAGGMGVVYLAYGSDGTPVAVKTLLPGASSESRIRMRQEAALLSSVSSPRVAAYVDADTDADDPWLALQYVSGPSLADVERPLPEDQLRQLASGLAEALAVLHAVGIVHRDVKPANIILTYAGPVLVDLGIARTPDMTVLTQAGMVIGSPTWMAPEQLRAEPPGTRTDVWAWGAVVAYAATGRPPFGDGPIEALAWRVQYGDPDLAGAPEWLVPSVTSALAKDPALRSMPGELPERRPSTQPLPAGTRPVAHTLQDEGPAIDLRATGNRDRSRGRRRVILAALGILTTMTVAAVVVLLPDADANKEPSASAGRSSTGVPTSSTTPATPLAWSPPGDELAEFSRALSHGESPPPFPSTVSKYTLAAHWRTTVRAFQGPEWATIPDFPATMNGCGLQRFYVRWRALNPEVTVEATLLSTFDEIVLVTPSGGGAGWMSGYGCGQPGFRVASSDGRANLTDVVVEVQRWETSV